MTRTPVACGCPPMVGAGFCSEPYDYDDAGTSYCTQVEGHKGFHLDEYGNRWVNEDYDEGW